MAAGRLTGLDTAFLCLDHEVSPRCTSAAWRSSGRSNAGIPSRWSACWPTRAQRVPQLRQRVLPAWFPLSAATWTDDSGFRAEDHIHLHHLGCHGSIDKAATLAAELLVRPLPRTRPLWEFHVISGVGGGCFAVLVKMHHAFGDGLSALDIGFRVLDGIRSRGDGTTSRVAVDDGSPLPSMQPSMLSRLWQVPGGVRDAVEGAVGQVTEATGTRGWLVGSRRGAGAIPLLADRLPPAAPRVAAPAAGQGASLLFDLMVTSIAVPGIRFTLDGAELAEVYPLAPLAAGQALVVGLCWYRDNAYVGLLADREGLPDVQWLAEAIQPAADALDV